MEAREEMGGDAREGKLRSHRDSLTGKGPQTGEEKERQRWRAKKTCSEPPAP